MKKESLNEELNRIKKLMNFDIGENSHDVLSENVIKTVNHLNEQTTKPPHKNLLGNVKVGDSSSTLPTETPSKGYVRVTNGNIFLAKSRMNFLKNFLTQNFKNHIGYELKPNEVTISKEPEVGGKEAKYQYAKATIGGILEKKEEEATTEGLPFTIEYDWYQLGGEKTPYVLVRNSDKYKDLKNRATDGGRTYGSFNRFKSSVDNSDSEIVKAAYSIGIGNANHLKMGMIDPQFTYFAFGKLNGPFKRTGNTFEYDNEEAWKRDVKIINDMDPKNKAGMKMSVDGEEIRVKVGHYKKGVSGNANFIVSESKGNLGDQEKMYELKPREGNPKKDIVIQNIPLPKLPYYGITNMKVVSSNVDGGEIKDRSKTTTVAGETEFTPLAEIVLAGQFPNNMITINQSKYKEIMGNIKKQIDAKLQNKWRIRQMKISVEGGASSINATNILPSDRSTPSTFEDTTFILVIP